MAERLFPRFTVTTADGDVRNGLGFEAGDVIEMSGGFRPWWRRWLGLPARSKRWVIADDTPGATKPLASPWRHGLRKLRAAITARWQTWRALRRRP